MDATYLREFLSDSSRAATRNEIRELLKLMARPEIISLAGGTPSPQAFPIRPLAQMLPRLLEEHGAAALQYGPTEGDLGLRRELLKWMAGSENPRFAEWTPDHVLVTSASQQGLDLCSRVFISPGDAVVCALPSYLGALSAFSACGARLCGVPLDDDGMRVDLLEQRLVDLRRQNVRPKFVYTVPDFQNPSGVTLSLRRRMELLAVARDFDLLVLEDSPYRQLRYTGKRQPMLAELDCDGRVLSLFTFSKTLFPGLRLGWVTADPEIIARLVVAKQPVDLCTAGLSQLVAREFLRAGLFPQQIREIHGLYSVRRQAMLDALERYIDPSWGVEWTRPEGGMFLWVRLPEYIDAADLLQVALEAKVAFVTGRAFHCDGSGRNTLRLSFSFPDAEQIDTAIRRLARCIQSFVTKRPPKAGSVPEAEPILVGGDHALGHLALNLSLSEVVE